MFFKNQTISGGFAVPPRPPSWKIPPKVRGIINETVPYIVENNITISYRIANSVKQAAACQLGCRETFVLWGAGLCWGLWHKLHRRLGKVSKIIHTTFGGIFHERRTPPPPPVGGN